MDEVILISKLSNGAKAKVLESAEYGWENEHSLLKIATLLLPYIDDEKFCQAFDYLNCKMDHQRQVKELGGDVRYPGELEELIHELRSELGRGGHLMLDNIRYGKRSEEVDVFLTKVARLEKLFSSSQPNINTDSPSRCSKCNGDCLSAYRIIYGIVSPIIETLKNGQPK